MIKDMLFNISRIIKIGIAMSTLCLSAYATNPNSVELPQIVKVSKPAELSNPIVSREFTDHLLSQKLTPSNKFWLVYSDRKNNTTYSAAHPGAEKYSQLDFAEKVYVADTINGYALVFTPGPDIRFGEKTKGTTKGWIPMSHLLLWTTCPVDDKKIYEKAIIMGDAEAIKSSGQAALALSRKISQDPNTIASEQNEVQNGRIYFLYKIEGDAALIGTSYQAVLQDKDGEGLGISPILSGWVHRSSYTKWNQRSCLEKKWKDQEISKLGGTTLTIEVEGTSVKAPIHTYNPQKDRRWDGGMLRFPVLDDPKGRKSDYYVKAFVSPSESDRKKFKEDNEKWNKNHEVRNLIFVIDGTDSMEKYYSSVIDAITNFQEQAVGEFNVGAVIYRDEADGEYAIETLPLVPYANKDRWLDFLKTGGAGGVKSNTNDRDPEELVFRGIETALDAATMGFDPNNSNIMALVGDCGNRENEVTPQRTDNIIKKIYDNNFQFLFFQCSYPPRQSDAAGLLKLQMGGILKGLKTKYDATGLGKSGKSNRFKETKRPNSDNQSEFKYEYTADKGYQFVTLGMVSLNNPGSIEPEALTQSINEHLAFCNTCIQNARNTMGQLVQGNLIMGEEGIDNVLEGLNVEDRDLYKRMLKHNGLSLQGYTPKKNAEDYDQWSTVLFISETELANLLKEFGPAYEAAVKADKRNRKPYIDALTALAKSFTQDERVNLKDMKLGDITAYVGGLNVTSQSLADILDPDKNLTLSDLDNPHIVNDNDYMDILLNFQKKYKNLEKIKTKGDCTYKIGGDSYFWIPIEDLP
ncbi:MAG: hypothetical protein LUD17_11275 [Bacteroidales bacterium]|nr:hypothetical protein [Bacteroidales bacterium]